MTTFEKINNDAKVYSENARYIHYHTPDQLIKYYANYYDYKVMPTIDEFKEDVTTQQQFHERHGQEHLLFIFPENEQLDEVLIEYGKSTGCQIEHMELYRLKSPGQLRQNEKVQCEIVKEEGKVFDDFLAVCAIGERKFGDEFVELKKKTHLRDLYDERIIQIVGYLEGKAVGKIEAIVEEETIEIDDFYVLDSARRQGVGSKLQEAVYEQRGGREVILVADGNDTAREMYVKQGYEKVSERWEMLRSEK